MTKKPHVLDVGNHAKILQLLKQMAGRASLSWYDDKVHSVARQWLLLASQHLRVARQLVARPKDWRAVVSRSYYAAYNSSRSVRYIVKGDAQPIDLDLTLTDPPAARDHLVAILEQFLKSCGIRRRASLIPDAAIERLVWCSAGVPRDFLWLFQTALQHALQNRRGRVGVQEVNLAVGEFAQAKMTELAEDSTEGSDDLRELLENLQHKCLDELRSNSFLVKFAPRQPGYDLLQKLMDLRLVHLLHPSITPGKAGERYEAYLLDYSFYTGVRRRHGLRELHITSKAPPRYRELRSLPKVDVDTLLEEN